MTSTMKIDKFGSKIWINEQGEYHHEDGPACESYSGNKWWLIKGKFHRIGGPAVEWADGNKEWWIEDKWITDLVRELLLESEFGEDVHLGILAEYWAERDDFRLLEIVQPYLAE